MQRTIKVLSLLLVLFCSASIAFGQEQFGSLEITTKDSADAVVPGVAVTVASIEGTAGFRRTVTTDSSGFVRIPQMPPGVYSLTAAATSGFAETSQTARVELGKATQFNLVMGVTLENVVDVTGGETTVDMTGSEITTSVNAAKIDLLPKGTQMTTILKVIPGTREETLSGGFSIDGASGAENTFVIDGQEVTNYRNAGLNGGNNVPFALIQEVQVKSSGFNAEFGGATGGVINVVTKGGNNDFHGDFGVEFEPSKFRGGNRPSMYFPAGSLLAPEYFDTPKSDFLITNPSFNLSGPIIKDRVWFFGSFSPRYVDETVDTQFYNNVRPADRVLREVQTYTAESIQHYAFGRIDASPFSKLRLTGTYLWNPLLNNGILPFGTVSTTARSGGLLAPECTNFFGTTRCGNEVTSKLGGRQTSNNVTFQAVYTPASWMVTSFRFSRGYLNEKLGNYNIPVSEGTRYICQQGNRPGFDFGPDACTQGVNDSPNDKTVKDISIRTNYEGDVSFLFNGGGRHELKTGYGHQSIDNDLEKASTTRIYLEYGVPINDNFNWTTLAIPSPDAVGHGVLYRYGEIGKGSNLNQSLYLQDKWQPHRQLTLNLGVRIEKEALPTFNGFDAPFSFGWGDKIAPRIGAAFDVFGNGKTKIFGSYGKFYDRLKFKMAQGSFGGNFYRVDFFEIFEDSGPYRTAFTPATILGNFSDVGGGNCPLTGFIGSGLSRCQNDYRVASNLPGLDITEGGGVDANLRPFQQREFTFGVEQELSRNFVLKGRFTNKKLIDTVEDAGAISSQGSEIYITGNPGRGLHAQFLEEFGYEKPFAQARRDYNAVEVSLDRRFAQNYFFNVNYTYSRLRGNYSGLANADEAGRSDPGVNRSFDLPMIGFTAQGESDYGPLPTDRPHVVNAYGGYVFDWGGTSNSTELSAFQTFQSGTPMSTTIDFIVPIFLNERGDRGRTPMYSTTDFSVTHKYKFGRDNRFGLAVNVNFLNLFDQETVTGEYNDLSANSVFGLYGCPLNEGLVDYPCIINAFNRGDLAGAISAAVVEDPRYGYATAWQAARRVRFGFKFTF